MNKKAIITYAILLAAVLALSLYISNGRLGGGTASTTTDYTVTTTISGASGQSGNATNVASGNGTAHVHGAASCVAGPEYSCGAVSLSNVTGMLSIAFVQHTGLAWSSAGIFFLNDSEIPDVENYSAYGASGARVYNVSAGSSVNAQISVIPRNSMAGARVDGQVWSAYSIYGSAAVYYGRVANVSVSAT
ncbi:MAG: hypothetical protein M1321_01320 [Candidatus Marsarchaeota archaeon]|jgi:hypothetical protein|nr:hypothetical protein [Candidatus Marsarchaeota archaeon]